MPNRLQNSLQVYLSKVKIRTPQLQMLANPINSSTSCMLSGCRHLKSPSFAVEQRTDDRDDKAATLTDINRFLSENFRSLYCSEDDDKKKDENEDHEGNGGKPNGILLESPRFIEPPTDLHASQRFFVSLGTSNSLVDEARSSASTFDDVGVGSTSTTLLESIRETTDLPDGSIAMLTYSPDPYEDFRRSIQEMVEVRLHQHQTVDWDFMEELLFCYLKLNEKKSNKYILAAFVDVIISLRQNSSRTPVRSPKIRTSRERRRRGNVT